MLIKEVHETFYLNYFLISNIKPVLLFDPYRSSSKQKMEKSVCFPGLQKGSSAQEVGQAADRGQDCDVIALHAELHHALRHDRSN